MLIKNKSLTVVLLATALTGATFSSAYAQTDNAQAPAVQTQGQANAATPAAKEQVPTVSLAKAQAQSVAVDTGVGIQLTVENGVLQVENPAPAAKKAGVKSGDVIAKINQQSVKNMTLAQAVELINGKNPSDEKVALTVIRKGHAKPVEISLARESAKTAQSGKSA